MRRALYPIIFGSPNYSLEARALFAAMTTQPTAARKSLINNTIVALKNAGIWAALDTLYLMAAADSQAARINWKLPGTYDLVAVNSPTFAADRGFTGNGTSSRLRTGYTPSANGVQTTLNSASIWAWSLTNSQSFNDAGNNSVPRTYIIIRNSSDLSVTTVNDSSGSATVSNTNSVGFFGGQRLDASTKRIFKNGLQLGSDFSVSSSSLASQEQWVCGANSTVFSTHQISAAAWGASLSGLELQFYNIMLGYMQGVGAA